MNRRNSLISPLLGGAAILVALYTILFGGVRSFTTEDAERMLAELSEHFAHESSSRSKETKLQYSTVEMEGIAYDKRARISQLALDFIYQQWQGGTRFGVSTQSALMAPDHAFPGRIMLQLPETLNVILSSELLAMVRPGKPILYVTNLKSTEAPGTFRHKMMIPGNLTILTLQPRREISLKLKEPIQAEIAFFESQRRLHAQVISGPLQAMFPASNLQVGNADIRYESTHRGGNVVESKGTLTLDKIAFNSGNIASPNYTATAAWEMKEQLNINGAADTAQLLIDHALITSGDMKVALNGTMNFDIDDAAYGELMMEINNVDAFIASSWIRPDKRMLAQQILSDILNGEKVVGRKQAIIPIRRAKNGEWHIGKLPLKVLLDEGFMDLFILTAQDQPHDQSQEPAAPAP